MPSRKQPNAALPDLGELRQHDLPLFITKAHLVFLQEYFAGCPDNEWPGRWLSDMDKTGIVITDQSGIAHDVIQKRPLIVSMRGNLAYANLAMDHLRTEDSNTGTRTHTDMLSCPVTLQCVAKVGLEAQRLAWCVARALRAYRRTLLSWGFHEAGMRVQVGPETPAGSIVSGDSDAGFVAVAVYHEVRVQDTWTVQPLDDITLRSIQVDLEAAPLHALGAPPDPTPEPSVVQTVTVLTPLS